jgi:hypothetical protein
MPFDFGSGLGTTVTRGGWNGPFTPPETTVARNWGAPAKDLGGSGAFTPPQFMAPMLGQPIAAPQIDPAQPAAQADLGEQAGIMNHPIYQMLARMFGGGGMGPMIAPSYYSPNPGASLNMSMGVIPRVPGSALGAPPVVATPRLRLPQPALGKAVVPPVSPVVPAVPSISPRFRVHPALGLGGPVLPPRARGPMDSSGIGAPADIAPAPIAPVGGIGGVRLSNRRFV